MTGGVNATPEVWRYLRREARAAQEERQDLLLAYEDLRKIRGEGV